MSAPDDAQDTPENLPHPGDEGHDSPVRFTSPDTPEIRALYAAIPERSTIDYLMRTTQQHHVRLSVMADTKASIIITVSSIVLTITLSRINDAGLRLSMTILMGFTLTALLLAILTVLPKYRPLRLKRDDPLPPNFNILFFGHFAELDQQRFLRELAARLKPGQVYPVLGADIYSLGSYLSHHKYRYLRLSYICFLLGFVLAVVVQMVKLVAGSLQ